MTKDEALKMAIEGMAKAEKAFDDLGLLLIKFGVNPSDINFHKESFLSPVIQACKEALAQPSIAELNDEYLRDTHVEGLEDISKMETTSQPGQEVGDAEIKQMLDDIEYYKNRLAKYEDVL